MNGHSYEGHGFKDIVWLPLYNIQLHSYFHYRKAKFKIIPLTPTKMLFKDNWNSNPVNYRVHQTILKWLCLVKI